MNFTVSRFCALIACIIFILAAIGVSLGSVGMVPLGLAFLAASFLIP